MTFRQSSFSSHLSAMSKTMMETIWGSFLIIAAIDMARTRPSMRTIVESEIVVSFSVPGSKIFRGTHTRHWRTVGDLKSRAFFEFGKLRLCLLDVMVGGCHFTDTAGQSGGNRSLFYSLGTASQGFSAEDISASVKRDGRKAKL
jgi:hypothetical protein